MKGPEEQWKHYLKLDDQMSDAELKFARAVIKMNNVRMSRTNPVNLADFSHVHFEVLEARSEMRSLQDEIEIALKHLDDIGFCP